MSLAHFTVGKSNNRKAARKPGRKDTMKEEKNVP